MHTAPSTVPEIQQVLKKLELLHLVLLLRLPLLLLFSVPCELKNISLGCLHVSNMLVSLGFGYFLLNEYGVFSGQWTLTMFF